MSLAVLKYAGNLLARAVTSAFVRSALSNAALIRDRILPVSKGNHFRELRSKIKDMPFLYRDLESEEIVTGYVEVDKDVYEINALGAKRKAFAKNPDDRIRNSNNAIILGSAGIGKTTFVRQAIIGIVEGKGRSSRFVDEETLLPFYVPLKAVDPGHPTPILSYLLNNYRYLAGSSGFERLLRAARNRSVFLLLDGYDEIPPEPNNSVLILEELRLMMQLELDDERRAMNYVQYLPLYQALKGCRLWLSSRREFFEHSPLRFDDKRAIVVELKGVRTHRTQLVNKIFDKFRKRSEKYKALLSEEYFVQELDASPLELIELSFNPLFLTVMCYVYATRAVEANTHDVPWVKTMPELLLTCIDLLLIDLDSSKTADFLGPEYAAARTAYLRRRNEWVKEKREFLGYFAGSLMIDQKTSFDPEYVREKTKVYFGTVRQGDPVSERILKEESRFAWQLIFSGVFVMVDRHYGRVQLDFPHRRFREVLAAHYLNAAETNDKLLNLFLERHDLAEVLFTVLDRPEVIVGKILERSRFTGSKRFNLTLKAIAKNSQPQAAYPTIVEFLKNAVFQDWYVPAAEVVPEIFRPEPDFFRSLTETLPLSYQHSSLNALLMTLFLLRKFDSESLHLWLTRKLYSGEEYRLTDAILLAHSILLDPGIFVEYFDRHKDDEPISRQLLYVGARATEMLESEEVVKFIDIFVARLTYKQRQLLVGFAALHKNPRLRSEKLSRVDFPRARALYELAQLLPIVDGSECYVVDDLAIAAASDLVAQAELTSRKGDIEFTKLFLEKIRFQTANTEFREKEKTKIASAAALKYPPQKILFFEDLSDHKLSR